MGYDRLHSEGVHVLAKYMIPGFTKLIAHSKLPVKHNLSGW